MKKISKKKILKKNIVTVVASSALPYKLPQFITTNSCIYVCMYVFCLFVFVFVLKTSGNHFYLFSAQRWQELAFV